MSSTPVIVTFCGDAQLRLVNVSLAGLTVPSPVRLLETPISTLPLGAESSTTWNVAVPGPFSLVVRLVILPSVMPGESSSVFDTLTSSGLASARYNGSLLVIAPNVAR